MVPNQFLSNNGTSHSIKYGKNSMDSCKNHPQNRFFVYDSKILIYGLIKQQINYYKETIVNAMVLVSMRRNSTIQCETNSFLNVGNDQTEYLRSCDEHYVYHWSFVGRVDFFGCFRYECSSSIWAFYTQRPVLTSTFR